MPSHVSQTSNSSPASHFICGLWWIEDCWICSVLEHHLANNVCMSWVASCQFDGWHVWANELPLCKHFCCCPVQCPYWIDILDWLKGSQRQKYNFYKDLKSPPHEINLQLEKSIWRSASLNRLQHWPNIPRYLTRFTKFPCCTALNLWYIYLAIMVLLIQPWARLMMKNHL